MHEALSANLDSPLQDWDEQLLHEADCLRWYDLRLRSTRPLNQLTCNSELLKFRTFVLSIVSRGDAKRSSLSHNEIRRLQKAEEDIGAAQVRILVSKLEHIIRYIIDCPDEVYSSRC